jgi:hypothetical protein
MQKEMAKFMRDRESLPLADLFRIDANNRAIALSDN